MSSTNVQFTRVLLAYLLIFSIISLSFSFMPINSGVNKPQALTQARTALKATFTANHVLLGLQTEIKVQESRRNQPLEDGSTVVVAARILHDDGTSKCEGYLLRNNESNDFEAHISCDHSMKSIDLFSAVFHKLLLEFLVIETNVYEAEKGQSLDTLELDQDQYSSAKLNIIYDEMSDELSEKLSSLYPTVPGPAHWRGDEDFDLALGINLPKFIPFLNEYTFKHRGTEQGITSLEVLKMLSARRVPFIFTGQEVTADEKDEASIKEVAARERSVISLRKQILSPSIVNEVTDIVEEIKRRNWLSTNPDSVDGLPSLHLNIVSNGSPLFDEDDGNDDKEEITFARCISNMSRILRPCLYDELLPAVRKMTNSPTVSISDVFIRNYGKMECGHDDGSCDDEGSNKSRYGLSPHYDVTAYATCVMALDSTAVSGKSGLYTIPAVNGTSSNNAALRRFFPLDQGDGVVHTYDILHGVDVDPSLNRPRTSLIVWFVDHGDSNREKLEMKVNQPWLLDPIDDVGEFVLGLASESSKEDDGSHLNLKNAVSPLDLYLSSASSGNIFAITTLGQMCDDELVPDTCYEKLTEMLVSHDLDNPFLSKTRESGLPFFKEEGYRCKSLANALWYHASIIGGNRVSQVSLADELMLQYMMDKEVLNASERENILLMASTLFTMALYQGYDTTDSLRRLMDVECRRLGDQGIEIPSEDFFSKPVVQILIMSI